MNASRRRDQARWRLRASAGEALRAIRYGGGLAGCLIVIIALLVGSTTTMDVVETGRIVGDEARYLAAGGDIIVASRNKGSLDASQCVGLARIAGVRTAVALSVTPDALTLAGRPESRQTLVTATGGVLDLFGLPFPGGEGVVVAQRIADRWQWAPGAHLRFEEGSAVAHSAPTGELRVAAVADLGKLGDPESTAILALGPARGPADSCYVRIMPPYREILTTTLPAALGDTPGSPVQVSDLVPRGEFAGDPAAEFTQRGTRHSGLLAGAVIALLWAVIGWMRKSRAALYASLGVPYSAGVIIRWLEGTCIVIPGVCWGVLLAVLTSLDRTRVSLSTTLDLSLRQGALALAIGLAGVLVSGLWRPATAMALKDR